VRSVFEGQLLPKVRKCFGGMEIAYSGMTPAQDVYPQGASTQWEMLIGGNVTLAKKPEYVLYMEPDCVPVRSMWLDVVRTHTDGIPLFGPGSFWIKGSILRGSAAVGSLSPAMSFHINGNSIYNLAGSALGNFYRRDVQPFIKNWHGLTAYDTDIYDYLLNSANYPVTQRIWHKFVPSDFVMNMWYREIEMSEFLAENPNTVLVHQATQRVVGYL